MASFIPVNEPLLNGNEKEYLLECLNTGWISSEGPFVREFEEKMSARVNRKFGIAVCNGTAALETAVAALELESGDEVIMPTFTIISCAAAVVRRGCIPVLVDSDPATWNMDVSQVEEKINSKTKAIMVVHIYGLPVDIDPVLDLAKKYGLYVIEDAAEMHGQTYKGKPCGSFGDLSIFSFYPNKHLTTGEGGMVHTDDERLAERCRLLRNLCFKPQQRFVHDELGYNFRMTNLQAALGLAQLERLDEFVAIKRAMGKKYTDKLKDVQGLCLPLEQTAYADNIYWVYGVVIKNACLVGATEVMKKLTEHQVGTRPFFWPMHQQPVFQKMGLFKGEKYPVAEWLARQGFYLPSGLALTGNQIDHVADVFRAVMKEIAK